MALDRPALSTIPMTPQMIEAGVYAARDHQLGADLAGLARDIYIAMITEAVESGSLPHLQGSASKARRTR